MPSIKKIITLLAVCLLTATSAFPQDLDTLAIVRLENVVLVQPDTVEFDIRLIRISDRWDRWANGTFQIEFVNSPIEVSDQRLDIEYYYGSSDLNTPPISGQLPKDSYYITPRIFPGRISITIAGPEEYGPSQFVAIDSSIFIGSFRIASKLGEVIGDRLDWLMPQYYYQACAYKISQDSIYANAPWGFPNDNFEMDNDRSTTVRYETDDTTRPEMCLLYFKAEYAGRKKVLLSWETCGEAYNRGFILTRGMVPYNDSSLVNFNHPVARYDGGTIPEDSLIGLGTRRYGRKYHFMDTVPYRNEEYCYLLQYENFDGNVCDIAYFDTLKKQFLPRAVDCLPIPNAVIIAAHADPNPFSYNTRIRYFLDDEVMLTVNVYDLLGNKVETLIDNEIRYMGWNYDVNFIADKARFASNGLYEVIFLARPIDDPNVEISRAIVKIQLLR